jgi:phage gp36-like protein
MGTAYVTPAQLPAYGLNPNAIQKVSQAEQLAACAAASATADSYFRGRYPLPFLTFDVDIVLRVAHVAIWLLLSNRGRDPGAGYDDQIDKRYEEAIAWFGGVQRQAVHPNVTLSQVKPPQYSFPAVITSRQRGWTRVGRW